MAEQKRSFTARPAARGEEPLLIGLVGPPGGGKTYSALRLARGMQQVRKGDVILLDTEGGRARKYGDEFKFLHVPFDPPHRPNHFGDAIQQFAAQNPAAIIVDSMSDEHEGQGGYLEWHDEMLPSVKDNKWAAWAQPKAARKRMLTGLLHIKVPLIFTFRAREKTKQEGKTIVNLGMMPVAPLEIVHTLDLVCLLPPRADGVPVWTSAKVGEDFTVKLPAFLKPFIKEGQLDEQTGAALARWAAGTVPQSAASPPADMAPASDPVPPSGAGADSEYEQVMEWDERLTKAAAQGMDELRSVWGIVPIHLKKNLMAARDNRHKPAAEKADQAKQKETTP